MTFINRIIKGLDSLISTIAISLLLILMLFGSYALYDVYKVYDQAKLDDDIATLRPQTKGTSFNLSDVQKLNKDIAGWIIVDDTNIDYPILHGKDNSEYLSINYKGEYAAAGSVFLDYRNDKFTNDYSIIYAHNMNANLMFGEIKNYKDEVFFKHHLTGRLYTDEGVYKLEILSYAMVSAYDNLVYGLSSYKNGRNFEIAKHIESNTIHDNNISDVKDEKLLLLSTCDASGVNERSILLAKLTKLEEKEIKTIAKNDKKVEKLKKDKEEKEKKDIFKYVDLWDLLFIICLLIVVIIYIILFIIKNKSKKKRKKKSNKKKISSKEKFKMIDDEDIEFIDLKK